MESIKTLKYKKIRNFLTAEETALLNDYARISHRINCTDFDFTQNLNGDTYMYGDPVMESLMLNKRKLMEKETGLKLLPTYSFWRMYTINAELKKHKDRPSCEISVTVMLGSDGTNWPIYMEDQAVDLNPGDAVIYLGCELNHYRKPFNGDWHAQAFLHYVDLEGPYTEHVKDKRNLWGVKKNAI
jgi:hypothetical protein